MKTERISSVKITGILSLLFLLMLPGCKKSGEEAIRGRYTTSISHRQAPLIPEMVGPWEITLGPEGKYSVRRNNLLLILGEYAVHTDTLRIFNETGVAACTDQLPASYRWRIDKDSLILAKLADTCPGRAIILTTNSLIRKE